MGSHVEEKEIAFLGAENALIDQAFCQTFSDLLELKAYLEDVPCFT
jgi:hypothetical protein